MYRRNNYSNYKSTDTEVGQRSKIQRLMEKYGVDYSNLEKCITQVNDGTTSYETRDEKQYLYCSFTDDWYINRKDPERIKKMKEKRKELEKEKDTKYLLQPTSEKPDVMSLSEAMQRGGMR